MYDPPFSDTAIAAVITATCTTDTETVILQVIAVTVETYDQIATT